MSRWMALDVGRKKVGVALTDPLKIMVRPLTTLQRESQEVDVEKVRHMVREHEVERIIVGMPRHLGGQKSAVLEHVEPLIERLRESLQIPVEWAEERLSTKEAERLMRETGLSLPERRKKRDEFSAAVILQWYLNEHG